MTHEVDPNVRRKFKLTLPGVGRADVSGEKVIEAMAALRQLLRIHKESDGEVVASHRPAIAPVIAALECATGSACSPAYRGQLFFLRMAVNRRQKRRDGERNNGPEQ